MKPAHSFSDRVVRDTERGEIRDGDARYLMIRADVLMGLFHGLDKGEAARALQALADSVHQHGARSARMYREMGIGSGDNENARLLSTIEATAPELGWGNWTLTLNDSETVDAQSPPSLHLRIFNSPFAAGYGSGSKPVCAPVCGMLRVLGEMIFDFPVQVQETACAATSDDQHCHFSVTMQPPHG